MIRRVIVTRESRSTTLWLICTTSVLLMFAAVEGCITSWIVSQYNKNDNAPSSSLVARLRYLIFCSWWTVFMNFLYIIAFFTEFMGVFGSIASNVLYVFITWVFWLAGAAAWTNVLGGGIRCGHRYFVYCHQLVAAEAFAWILWILYCFQLVLVLVIAIMGLCRGDELETDMREVETGDPY